MSTIKKRSRRSSNSLPEDSSEGTKTKKKRESVHLDSKASSGSKAVTAVATAAAEAESSEHASLLSSVTGQLRRLPVDDSRSGSSVGDAERKKARSRKRRGAVVGEAKENSSDNNATVVVVDSVVGGGGSVDKQVAAQYLVLWDSNRDAWSFKKKIQYWLLQNMYHKKKVSKASFKIMLCYMDGLRGNQRELAKGRAEKMAAQSVQGRDRESRISQKRARQVLRILSEE